MTPEEWGKVKAIFHGALDVEPTQRATFLERECGSDAQLRAEVESLLLAHDSSEAFLDRPAAAFAPDLVAAEVSARWIGRRVGPYRIESLIGHGGMGDVYKAVRDDDQYRKDVAIKLVRAGNDTTEMVRRFRAERQILAGLEHPNIARLLDGGATDDGHPYLVMELVSGVPIDRYCTQHDLALADRVALFRMVCAAVHYAHQRLVIHRDLKPGNILVTAAGEVKLLDFGVAKLLEPSVEGVAHDATMTVMRAMTPDYCSPEQARGEVVTTASDIYSLGVVLYRLLTGRSPNRPTQNPDSDWIRELSQTEPLRPSAAADETTLPRHVDVDVHKWRRRLKGDLDSIVLTALRKEPARRYASADELSEDLRRYLGGQAVLARGDQFAYSAGKFIRRNKGRMAAGTLLLLSLIGGIVTTSREATVARTEKVRAERHFNSVRKLANSFIFEVHDAIANLPGSTAARQVLVNNAVTYLDSLSDEAGEDAGLKRELAAAYEKLGDVQGGFHSANLGNSAGAIRNYQQALTIREVLYRDNADDNALQRDLIRNHGKLGDVLYEAGDAPEAVKHTTALTQIAEKVVAAHPTDFVGRRNLALARLDLGTKRTAIGDWQTGRIAMSDSVQMLQRLLAERPQDPVIKRLCVVAMNRLGEVLVDQGRDLQRALNLQIDGRKLTEELLQDDALNTDLRNLHAYLIGTAAKATAGIGSISKAVQGGKQAVQELQSLADADADNAQYRYNLADMLGNVSELVAQSGDYPAALQMVQRALLLLEGLPNAASSVNRAAISVNQFRTGSYHEQLAALDSLKRPQSCKEAQQWYELSVAGLKEANEHYLLSVKDTTKLQHAQRGACGGEVTSDG
ncbi:MAG TPA: serine/threonine-protein kinase [Steroidobacteraceae bacterium]|jgi:non-specific serine/threonine protein kinase/serine/threonine-protein kinase